MSIYLIGFLLLSLLLLNLILFISLNKLELKNSHTITSNIDFSIVVAVKNEEISLTGLLSSLNELNYPKENFEIIFVDDLSEDETYSVLDKVIKSKENYKLIRAENKPFPGKKGALTVGIELAKFPFILITDGDCVVSKNWLQGFANKFQNSYDFVFGICPIIKEKSFVNLISCFENLRTEMLTFAIANLGLPYSAAARSFGFKKESFLKLDGYKNTTETLSGDDDLLLREAIKNKFKIGLLIEPDTFVYSKSETKLTDYFHQKTRHTSTSKYYLPRHKLVLGTWHLINIFALCSTLLLPFSVNFFFPFLIKIFIDVFLVKKFMKRFGSEFSAGEIIYLQFCYEVFLVIHYLNASFSRNITWNKT